MFTLLADPWGRLEGFDHSSDVHPMLLLTEI